MVFEVNTSAASDTLTVKDAVVVLIPSVTCTVKVKEPTEVGVPARIPLALRVIPGGNVPEASDQVIGPDLFCSSRSCT
jgi:hypothetical protein